MKLLVCGNVGSGKTTLLKKLQGVYPWQIIAIDDFRRKYGDGSKEKELIAQKHFFEAIIPNDNQFIECLGVGKVSEDLSSFLSSSKEKIICVKLIVPKKICKLRLKNRIWDIPFPDSLEKVSQLIDKTEDRIDRGFIEILWVEKNNATLISKQNQQSEDLDKIAGEIASLLGETTQ